MEPSSKILEQIAHNTRPKIEEHMLIVLDKSTHDEHLSQPLQTNHKQFKIAVTFLTGYNGIFIVTNSNSNFYFEKSIPDEDGFVQITIPLMNQNHQIMKKKDNYSWRTLHRFKLSIFNQSEFFNTWIYYRNTHSRTNKYISTRW